MVTMTKPIGILFSSVLLASRSLSTRAFSPPSLASFRNSALGPSAASSVGSSHGRSRLAKPATALFDTNPLRSLFQNFQSRGMSTSLSSQQLSRLTSLTAALAEPSSWEEIRAALTSQQTPQEREFRSNLPKGVGVGSPLHTLRLFDEENDEEDVRVTLFRDSASWCPYCQKVWMTLEQKRIPYRITKINMRCYGDKPSSFTKLQPSGAIPVAIIDGATYRQSNDIIFALEEKFPESEAMVYGDQGKIRELLGLERKLFSSWMYWLTSYDGPNGKLRKEFLSTLMEVERALQSVQGRGFFMGDKVSVVDCMFAPFLERMAASMLYFKGLKIRVADGEKTDFPAVNRWFDAMETLPSYQLTKSDYYTHCWDLPPQLGGCVAEPGSEPFQIAINGETAGSWSLPLSPHNDGVEPDWAWAGGYPGDEKIAMREAVERVSANHEAIVKFACRGAGKEGFPRYGAPLADPNAMSNEAVQPFVDVVLRVVCSKLLSNDATTCDKSMNEVVSLWKKEGGDEIIEMAATSLEYMRDRVGVPRDMRLPAARQLRAHLNWAITALSQ
ncbi:hypothetical protein HJC23_000457 [Cyclotella cryptica]|uniref:glutathione dehydrogenase (ascorbate) n=1 Tax=Cyclotella cryptica TaxID=29204 RepID=A0ABD3QAR6_9STRA|eukprot:CCRYP_007203-RA/>CCRYP_007203-RA protein AED:0.05 eAED:0.05 QI:36/1/1/1/1/1/3/79/556